MTAPRDGYGGSHFVALLNGERIEPMPGPPVLRAGRYTIDIDMSAFPPAPAFDERAAVLVFIDAALAVPLPPYLRDKLADLLIERMQAEHFFDPWHGSLDGVQPLGLLSAFAPGYPCKARHKPRRPRKVAR